MNKQFKFINPRMDSNVGAAHNGAINPFIVSAEEIVVRKYKPRLWGNFESSEDFLFTLEVLENATENDVVEMHINSGGGSVDSIVTLTHAMRKCAAHISIVYTGMVASAATMPMFFADELEIADHTSFLFHEPIVGAPNETLSANKAFNQHKDRWLENLTREMYKGFFTEEEIEERLLKGEQVYMMPDEVVERWQKRNELLQQQLLEQEDNEENDAEYTASYRPAFPKQD